MHKIAVKDEIVEDFSRLVGYMVRKNLPCVRYLPAELENECRKAVFDAVHGWKGTRGKLTSWVYTVLEGRMKDLAKTTAKAPVLESLNSLEESIGTDKELAALSAALCSYTA